MAVPQDVIERAIDDEGDHWIVICPECPEYSRDFSKDEKEYGEVKRQFASHYSQRHMDGGGGSETSSNDNQDNETSGSSRSSEPAEPAHEINERELIYQRGEDGLSEIKQERLQDWLRTSEGVGPQTEDRVMKIFERNGVFRDNPHALHSMLEEQINASSSYINTIVQDVFAPEKEHEDILREQGFIPWYRKDMPGGQQATQQGGTAQFNSMGGQQQQGMRQMQGGQQQPEMGQQAMTFDEAVELIRESQEKGEEPPESAREKLRHGLSEATDEAIRNAASEFGGFFSRINNIVLDSIAEYAKENPEWVVENLDILEKVFGELPEKPRSDMGGSTSERDRQVNDAVSRVQSEETSSPIDVNGAGPDEGFSYQDSGFQPSEETRQLMEEGSQDEQKDDQEESQVQKSTEDTEEDDEDEETDELVEMFGSDLVEQ